MKKLALSVLLVVVAAGCSLRPRYNDYHLMVDVLKEARFVVVNPDDNKPIANAKIELGDGRNKYTTTSDAKGGFLLPVEKRYVDDNPVLVVTLPKGVEKYEVRLAPPPAPELPPAAATEPAPVETTPVTPMDAADGGANPLATPVQAK